MKNFKLLIILLHICVLSSGQTNQEVNLIHVDSNWGKEIIQIPFWFAPEINYEGYEDIRFAKGWENIESAGFWTLVFAWDMNLYSEPKTAFFEDNLKLYFEGLMKVVNEDTSLTIPKTKVFLTQGESINKSSIFKGTIETYDAFTTKEIITLNLIIENYYCEKTNKYLPLFRISPKDFSHESWDMLEKAKLITSLCENKI